MLETMLKVLTDYAKIMPENFTKKYAINVIMLDLSQIVSNYARIMPKIVSVMTLCQNYARKVIMLE